MSSLSDKKQSRLKRKKRVRKKISGTSIRPRITVFRSTKHIYAQAVDDVNKCTITSVSSLENAVKEHSRFESKVALGTFIGKLLGERVLQKGIKTAVFDRNGFLYHGRVRALAEGAREAGLDF
ncbi:MAG TPA: 50S ribosomal protein L18 [Desulfobacteraceae bacterium]|nr:50S ribosomal protein L18 [Desulfobacteraceae bacterium]